MEKNLAETDNSDVFLFLPNMPKMGVSGQKRKNRVCACLRDRYLLYQTVLHGGRQKQRYFNASTPSSRRDN